MHSRFHPLTVVLACLTATGVEAEPQPPQAPDPHRSQPLLWGRDFKITVGEIEDAIRQESPYLGRRYSDPENLRKLVSDTARFELLAREAERRGYGKHAEVIK